MLADWVKPFLPLLETGMKLFASQQFLKASSENAKGIAKRSGMLVLGGTVFFVFGSASLIMVFVDLGRQLETHDGLHFSGMMWSAGFLFTLALIFLGVCFFSTKFMNGNGGEKKAKEEPVPDPYAILAVFAQEFLKQLVVSLNRKAENASESQEAPGTRN